MSRGFSLARLCGAAGMLLASAGVTRADYLETASLSDEILRFSNQGGNKGAFVTNGSGGINSPMAMTYGQDGALYVAAANGIFVYNPDTGAFLRQVISSPNLNRFGIETAPNGDLLVTMDFGKIQRINPQTGAIVATITSPLLHTPGKFLSTGNGKYLLAESSLNTIVSFDSNTNSVTGVFASGGGLAGPFGMEYGPDGAIYVCDLYGDGAIRRVSASTGVVLGSFTPPILKGTSDVIFRDNTLITLAPLSGDMMYFDAVTAAPIKTMPGGTFGFDLLHMPEPSSATLLAIGAVGLLKRARRR